MHKTRLLVIMMFVLTTIGGAAVAGFGTANASVRVARHVRTQVTKNGCRYSGKSVNLGVHTSHIVVTKDTCHRDMRAFAYCTTLILGQDYAVGPWRTNVGKESTASCPHLDDGVYYSGYRYVYYKCVFQASPSPHCVETREIGTYGLQGSP